MSETYDVVIVGGGLSGLAAAHLLLKERSNIKIKVIEASDQVCYGLKTIEMESANGKEIYDIGSSRVGSAQPLMLALLKEFDIETYPHYDKGTKHWQLADGKVKSYSGAIPPMPYTSLVDLLRYFRKMDKIAEKINLSDVSSTENCGEYDSTTVEAFINKFLWLQAAKELASTMVGTFMGMPPSELTLLMYGYVIKTCGNWDKHVGGEGTGRMDLKIKGGVQQLAERLREKVGDERLILGDAVTRIEQPDDRSKVTVHTRSGLSFDAKRAVVAVPGRATCDIEFVPALPVPRNLPEGRYTVHFIITYRKCFWREKKMAGELLSMAGTLGGFKNEDNYMYPLIAFFDHTSHNGNPALFGLFSSSCYSTMTTAQRKLIAVDFIASILGDEAKDIVEYADYDWSKSDTVDRPAPSSEEFKTSQILDSLTKPHGCVHFAGQEAGVVWAGMMECAVEASHRVVREVLAVV